MAHRYAGVGVGGATTNATAGSVLSLQGTSAARFSMYDWMFGCSASADDNVIVHEVARFTVQPNSGGGEPKSPLDPADGAARVTVLSNTTAGTWTSGAILLRIPTNQRASHRWVAAPDSEIIGPATSSNGFGHAAISSSYTGQFGATMLWVE